MIGQVNLRHRIDSMIEEGTFPAFSIVFGPEGSGKHTLCEYIAEKMDLEIVYFDNKVEDIRNFIETSYSQSRKIIYVLQDIDDVSNATKNSLLKITEEPVRNSYIIILSSNKNQLPLTLLSRGFSFDLQPYSTQELLEWIKEKNIKLDNLDDCLKVCYNVGDINKAINTDITQMLDYSKKIILSMKQATISNALMITNKIVDNYDIGLFFNCLQYNLLEISKTENNNSYLELDELLLSIKNLIGLKTANKKMLLDEFVLKSYLLLNRG